MASSSRSDKVIYWQKVFEQHKESGLSVRAFCIEKRISANLFYQWRKKLQAPPQSSTNCIIPVRLVSTTPAASASNYVVQILTPDGFSIRVDSSMQSDELSTILRAISASTERGESC